MLLGKIQQQAQKKRVINDVCIICIERFSLQEVFIIHLRSYSTTTSVREASYSTDINRIEYINKDTNRY